MDITRGGDSSFTPWDPPKVAVITPAELRREKSATAAACGCG